MTERPLSALAITCMISECPTQAQLEAEADFWNAFDAGDLPAMEMAAHRMGAKAEGSLAGGEQVRSAPARSEPHPSKPPEQERGEERLTDEQKIEKLLAMLDAQDAETLRLIGHLLNANERTLYALSAETIRTLQSHRAAAGREEAWTCPMRGQVLSCGGKPMKLMSPSDRVLFSCTVWECPHTAKAQ